jgi:hypothetical protein
MALNATSRLPKFSDMLAILIDQSIASGGPFPCHLVGAAALRHEGAGG